ncbi:MAG: putative metal-dependent hydrolase [Acidobacteria bacterium]|nr:putative metal-dependent hydrolase [Acidobacteriota bacterium]
MTQTTDLQYPIGKPAAADLPTPEQVAAWIDDIAALPADLRRTVAPLADNQLDTPYRPGGWTVRQVVYHLPDSHMNSLVRFKWALTEERPLIKAYDEKGWAALPDCRGPIDHSLDFLEALHARWVDLLRSLSWTQLQREFVHPESGAATLAATVGLYAWHGRHHLAHIERLIEREGWG